MGFWQGTLEGLVVQESFWKNKTVLITGHTGFKGSWLSIWLQSLGANVVGFSLEPPTNPSLFEKARLADGIESIIGNICDLEHLKQVFSNHQFDVVIHLAGTAHVDVAPDMHERVHHLGTVALAEAAAGAGRRPQRLTS